MENESVKTREKTIQMVMDLPDHKIEQLFRDMGIELDLSNPNETK